MAMSPEPVRGNTLIASGDRRTALSGNSLAVGSMLTWAAGFPAAEILLQTWPPIALIVARLALAVAVMVPIWLLVDGPSRVRRARWVRAMWVGGLGFGLAMFLLLLAQKLTDPVTVAIIASSAPLIATLLEIRIGARRLRWNFAFGLVASIIGGLIATSAAVPEQLGLGAACAILSTVLFCWGGMATARDFPELSQVGRSSITLVGGLLVTSVLLIGAGQMGTEIVPSASFDMQQAGMLAIYALVALGLSQVLFVSSISKLGVALSSFHINIAPFYVMVILVMLGEEWNWTRALGAGIVALAVVLAQDRKATQTV